MRTAGWISAVIVACLGLSVAAPAQASICQCRRTEAGTCERWHPAKVTYSLYAPGESPGGITNDQFQAEVQAAFATWQAVQCDACSQAVGDACGPVPCAANPLGITFEFGGFTNQPELATQCLAPGSPSPCPGAAADTVTIALIRHDDEWPLDLGKVTQTVLTVQRKSGHVLDADILLRDTKHVFCLDSCGPGQYPLRAVLLREIGHLLGMGDSEDAEAVLAANFQPGAHVSADLSVPDMACACQIYRSSQDLADCQTPTAAAPVTSGGCTSGPTPPAPRWWLMLLAIPGLLLGRRYIGRRASVPARRA
jgi:MYXO-CTERM domain-containing protein